jgi:hypothetical protein
MSHFDFFFFGMSLGYPLSFMAQEIIATTFMPIETGGKKTEAFPAHC